MSLFCKLLKNNETQNTDYSIARHEEHFNGYRFNVADQHNFNVLNNEFVLSSLHTKSKDFLLSL